MTVRRLKTKQLGPKCSFCDEKAVHRGYGFGKFACGSHHQQLSEWDRIASAPDYSDAAFYAGY